jgi:hypothetical protein
LAYSTGKSPGESRGRGVAIPNLRITTFSPKRKKVDHRRKITTDSTDRNTDHTDGKKWLGISG